MLDFTRREFLYAALGLLSFGLFILDWLLPPGLATELFQVGVVLLTLFVEGRRSTVAAGGVTTLFVVAGYGIHWHQGASVEVLANYGIVLLGLWMAVAVVLAFKHALRAQRESEAQAQAILETTPDGIITIDEAGRVESVNQAAEEIFECDAEEIQGESVGQLLPSPYREEVKRCLSGTQATDGDGPSGLEREIRGRQCDGSTFPMDLAISKVALGSRTVYTGVVRDITDRRRLEKEVMNVSEQERQRIGQELHDSLGQMLTGIGLLSQNVARQLSDEGHERAEDLAEITDLVKEADQYARDLSRGLIPVDVEANGLVEALRRMVKKTERQFEGQCTFQAVGTPLVHDSTIATHLYRIAQEAINNAVRHGDPEHVRAVLAAGDERIRLQVKDDGAGFDRDELGETGMGLRIMSYRARLVGGTLDVTSAPGEGTTVTCSIPRSGGREPPAEREETRRDGSPAGI